MMFNRVFQYQVARSGQLYRATVLVLIVLTVLVVSGITRAPTVKAAGLWFVSNGGDDGNNCTSYLTTCASINAVLNKPSFVDGDTIRVAVGTYTGSGTEVVLLNKSATLSGGWDATFTTQMGMSAVDGEGARRGMTMNGAVTSAVDHFVFENGGGGLYGGGIYQQSGMLTLNHVVISGNVTQWGGGMYIATTGTAEIIDSAIFDNFAGSGGGIENYN